MIELRKEFEMWVNNKNTSDTDSKSTLFSQSILVLHYGNIVEING